MLTSAQVEQFQQNGYLVLPALAAPEYCGQVIDFSRRQLAAQALPIEYEADTGYAGAPASRTAQGGHTARRLLQAYARSRLLADWATGPQLVLPLLQLLGAGALLSQAHHNCIMTKQPEYSSATGWHRDSRYWHFQRAELVSAWLALRAETVDNGCLLVLPGSHRWELDSAQLDAAQFLRGDLPQNQALLAKAQALPLRQGDVLLFHSNLFHAAGKNRTDATKFSLVFTYRAAGNAPQPGSRSAMAEEIPLE